MAHQLVVVLDFGSQYTQLIARRIREQNVYCEIHPYTLAADPQKLRELNPIGLVLSGGPSSVYEEGAPQIPASTWEMGLPILGICYGAQLTAELQKAVEDAIANASTLGLDPAKAMAAVQAVADKSRKS